MIILGIDPGNARCGYGALVKTGSRLEYASCGCIETKKELPEATRLAQLDAELEKIIDELKPDEAAVEALFYFKNPKTVIEVAEARGVVLAALAKRNIRSFSYTPLQIKQAVTGYGRAEKNQILKMVMKLLKLQKPPRPDDAADALAVAICHASLPQYLKEAEVMMAAMPQKR
jgi:crossover junction endodeoxyribonuclease RuvC